MSFKRKNIIDLSIVFSIIFFFIHNKIPPERLLIPYIYLYLLYCIYDLKFIFKRNYFVLFIKSIFIIFIIIKIQTFKLHSSEQINLVELKYDQNIQDKCLLILKSNVEYDYHYFYFKYLENCKKKPDIFEFYNFYKTRIK